MVIPSTAYGLAVLLVLVLVIPGTVYAAVRTAVGGRGPHDGEATSRILRAILASAILISTYLLIFGETLVETVSAEGIRQHPRQAGLAGLMLGVALPAGLAYLVHGKPRIGRGRFARLPWLPWPRSTTGYEATPTAWDWVAPRRGGHWVRIRIANGKWVAGWFAGDSFMSTYPEPRDVFLQDQHVVDEKGKIGDKVAGSAGVWLALADDYIVEWLSPDAPTELAEVPGDREGTRAG